MTDRGVGSGSPPQDEVARLRALSDYLVAGTAPEARFDTIAELAAKLLDCPIAYLSLIEAERQWLKARIGIELAETPRCDSICTHAITSEDVLVIPDASLDPRFAGSMLVTGCPGVRFYAAAPLVTKAGFRIGALAVLDTKPRPALDAHRLALLKQLAAVAMEQLELRRLEYVNASMRAFADASEHALLTVTAEGHIEFVNPAAEALFGYGPGEMLGRPLDLIIPGRFQHSHAALLANFAGGAESRLDGRTLEVSALRRDGTEVPLEISISAWRKPTGIGMGAIMRDISERRERDARLLRMAHHDPLTGLTNRAHFHERLRMNLEAGVRAGVLLMDLDGFKDINDRLGHATGDTLLQALAVRLPLVLPRTAVIARLGGDEFAILLTGADAVTQVTQAAHKILAAFNAPFTICGHVLHLGASLGASLAPEHGTDPDDLVASADFALYRAKQEGRHRLCLFDPAMRHAASASRALQDELLRAIQNREFVLHYQPQVSLRTGEIYGAEALLRWNHPSRGLLTPDTFLATLETSSLALQVGWWTIDEACRQAASWRDAGLPPARIAVNLFAAQIGVGSLADVVADALARHDLPPDAIEIELTEKIALQHDDGALEPIRELRARGVGIAFDDFGTGYASLITLKRFPLTTLKIDRSFVRDLLDDPHDAAIVGSMVAMGRSIGLEVIAEGIETAEQQRALVALGCECGQGYLFGRPMPAEAFAACLGDTRRDLAA
jgi:diguanylate cyclase (GGDEF)-like protein/PAS domain S-box-containing protein